MRKFEIVEIFYQSKQIIMKNLHKLCALFTGFLILASSYTFAQTDKKFMHHEVPDDAFKPVNHQGRETSPAYTFRSELFFTTQVNVDEDGYNIYDDAGNEPSIAIDPTNPNRMLIGWRQFDDVTNNFRQAGIGYTDDGGETWTFPGVIDPGQFRSDPVLDSDADGNFYYNSLTHDANDDFVCDVYKINAGGFDWDNGTYAQGGDKQWMVIDKSGGQGDGNIYSFWTQSWSICYPGMFTRSVNGGASYEDCVNVEGEPYWGTLAVGPDGELYIVGSGYYETLVVAKSNTAQNPVFPVSWDFSVDVNLDGSMSGWSQINPEGLIGQAYIDVDRSDGPGRGNVYVLASVERYTIGDPCDVMFARSTDGGDSWDDPIRINDDLSNDNYQWFGTMSVAPNGRIDVVWLDTRDAPSNSHNSSLYYSYSYDQGETWTTNIRLSEEFNPHLGYPDQQKMGDYYHMVSGNDTVHLAWAATFNGEEDVYYGRITPGVTGMDEFRAQTSVSVSNFPNPFRESTSIRYVVSRNSHVELTVFDPFGKKIATLVDRDQASGAYKVSFDAGNLAAGVYHCRLSAGGRSESTKLVVM